MGYIDLKIDVTRGAIWWSRNLRMQRLKNPKKSPDNNGASTSSNCNNTNQSPDNNGASRSSYCNNTNQSPDNNGASTSSHCNNTNQDVCQNRMALDLYLAAKTGDVDALIDALERVSNEKNLTPSDLLDQVSPAGNTLLHLCVIYENKEGAAFIANHFPTLLARPNSQGNTALHLAARAGDRELVETLIGILDDHQSPTGFSSASSSNSLDLSPSPEKLPVQALPSVNLCEIRNKEGNTPLHESLVQGCRKSVAYFLVRRGRMDLYILNDQDESPLYLAAKAGEARLVENILILNQKDSEDGRLKGKSACHAAILKREQGVLKILLAREPRFILLRDEEGRTPLHLAASLGYLEEAKYLLGINSDGVFEKDNNGLLPIHLASIKGYKNLVWLLLQYWPEPCELLSSKGQNILHVAVESGGNDMVSYILGTTEFNKLINMKDNDGNTPLHIAAMSWHPKIVSILTWDKRVDLTLPNTQGSTALDCAEQYMETMPSFRMRLTWAALKSGGVPRSYLNSILEKNDLQLSTQLYNKPDMESYKDRVNTLLLVATLVATITFAAGFTMPGGYKSSDPDQGMATMLKNKWFHLFIFCDTIAMYSSIIVSVALIWAQLGDLNLVLTAFRLALPLLGVSLSMMSLSFVAGVYLVVSKLRWLAISVLVTGFVLLTILATLFFSLCFPISSNRRVIRYVTYYPICLLMYVIKNYN